MSLSTPIRRLTSYRSPFGHPVCLPTGSVPIPTSVSTGGHTGGPIGGLRNGVHMEGLGEDEIKQQYALVKMAMI